MPAPGCKEARDGGEVAARPLPRDDTKSVVKRGIFACRKCDMAIASSNPPTTAKSTGIRFRMMKA